MSRIASAAIAGAFVVLVAAGASAQTNPNTCVTCHAALHEANLSAPPKAFAGDVHDKANIRCADCHGGDPAAAEKAAAHSTAKGYKGKPSGAAICSSCHVLLAEKFNASVHAPIFERACVECHGNHGVKPPTEAMLGTSDEAICATCHSEKDDPGFLGAAKMRASLDGFREAIDSNTALIAKARDAGMEVGDQELALREARMKLVLARTEMHAFKPEALDVVVNDGMKIVTSVNQGGNRAMAELSYRRKGLFVSLGAILLVVVALALKIHELDKRSSM
jgi:predicted CXXCH cytochrome family protein